MAHGSKSEISNNDIYNLMKNILESNEEIRKQNAEINQNLKNFIETTNEEIRKLKSENTELKTEITYLKERILTTEKRQKKYNLVIYGIEEKDEKQEELNQFLNIINETLTIECGKEHIRDYYRLGKKVETNKTRPLLIELVNHSVKADILNKAKLLKGSRIYISRDYTVEDLQRRRDTQKSKTINYKTNNPGKGEVLQKEAGTVATQKKALHIATAERHPEKQENKKYHTRRQQ